MIIFLSFGKCTIIVVVTISLYLTSIFHPIRITTQNDILNDGISVTMDHLHEFRYTEIQNIAFIYLSSKKPNQ